MERGKIKENNMSLITLNEINLTDRLCIVFYIAYVYSKQITFVVHQVFRTREKRIHIFFPVYDVPPCNAIMFIT